MDDISKLDRAITISKYINTHGIDIVGFDDITRFVVIQLMCRSGYTFGDFFKSRRISGKDRNEFLFQVLNGKNISWNLFKKMGIFLNLKYTLTIIDKNSKIQQQQYISQ